MCLTIYKKSRFVALLCFHEPFCGGHAAAGSCRRSLASLYWLGDHGFLFLFLIGFWYARDYHLKADDIPHISPRKAGIKAFLTTRIADVVMLLGIVFFYAVFGTLNFAEAFLRKV